MLIFEVRVQSPFINVVQKLFHSFVCKKAIFFCVRIPKYISPKNVVIHSENYKVEIPLDIHVTAQQLSKKIVV